MSPNPIKAALKNGETIVGMWSATGSADLAEAAVRLGWTTIFLDNEHGVASLDRAVDIHRAVLSAGGDVILRVPSADPTHLKLVLDRGFRSIMAPMINTAEEAKAFVDACRYPPHGKRGYAAPIVRASGWGTVPGYTANAHEELLLIAQIEHVDAIDEIPAIAAVDGIDALLIGPNDLAGSMGMLERLGEAPVLEACERVEKAVVASGRWLGSITRPGRTAQDLHDIGCRLIAGPADIMIFLAGAKEAKATYAVEARPAAAPAEEEASEPTPAKATRRASGGTKAAGASAPAKGRPAARGTRKAAAAAEGTTRGASARTATAKPTAKTASTKTASAKAASAQAESDEGQAKAPAKPAEAKPPAKGKKISTNGTIRTRFPPRGSGD